MLNSVISQPCTQRRGSIALPITALGVRVTPAGRRSSKNPVVVGYGEFFDPLVTDPNTRAPRSTAQNKPVPALQYNARHYLSSAVHDLRQGRRASDRQKHAQTTAQLIDLIIERIPIALGLPQSWSTD